MPIADEVGVWDKVEPVGVGVGDIDVAGSFAELYRERTGAAGDWPPISGRRTL